MGIRLVVEVLRHAPETLTHREKLLLVALAEDANDDTRLTWSSVEDSKILVGAKVNRAQLYDVIKKLIAKSALARVTAGQRHAAAKYKILNLVQGQEIPDTEPELQGQEIPDTDQSQCQQIPDAEKGFSVRESLTRSKSQCQEIPSLSVRESLTPTPLLLEIDNSPSPRASPTPVEQPDPFDAFWTAYPRKTAKADARKAFAAAIKAGADPNTLPSTVARHHAHWIAEGRQPQYFPYPATWLRKGSYDDELIAPQPAGPQQSTHQTYADRGIF
ncbi:hypothetical protein ACFWOG_04505 [Kitasatospora sp. NPDC058406]|uniref:hypothetical protein n=1 Tax=Kitasatospora sp. NPDC058406 TaxID=3346483 RepID=UPI0036492284